MAGSYRFRDSILWLTFEGDTSPGEAGALLDAALADAACPVRPDLVCDLGASTTIGTRPQGQLREGIHLFARRADALSGRIAIIVDAPVQYGTMRMAGVFASFEGFVVDVFRDEAAALEWLSAPEDAPEDGR